MGAGEAVDAAHWDGELFTARLGDIVDAARRRWHAVVDRAANAGQPARLGERSCGVTDAQLAVWRLIRENMAKSARSQSDRIADAIRPR